ncbi:MAG: Aspartate carbamoyltransferase catalytic subunit [Chlamydiales bacterium]|nr:Aspartate carbamoyltransferase catalytic subunit [Chlamydiales bacterium]MCH9636193.1 Aspartate carbamoyltransferase catalytic subunit [Chlamydiales bacterium]MCH9704102.1 aspartate carbamoyltransferase [Chlamydiota bacterium]
MSLISMKELSKEQILKILDGVGKKSALHGKILACCFFEPSTRTRLSFEAAAKRLGMEVIGFSEPGNTSQTKGETLSDAIRVVSSYADLLVIRAKEEGAAKLAAEVASCPVINAGDGCNEHPTQALLDLYTIRQCQGSLDGLHIHICGDIENGRTAHSLALALKHFDCEVSFSEDGSQIREADILYVTRQQKERGSSGNYLRITKEDLVGVKPNLRILHPLPRVDEIATEVDKTPYAYYFEQAKNGVLVRQSILREVLEDASIACCH